MNNGDDEISKVKVVYPNSDGTYCKSSSLLSPGSIYIRFPSTNKDGVVKSYESWDVTMHEYAHHVQNELDFTDMDGTHYPFDNMADHFYDDIDNLDNKNIMCDDHDLKYLKEVRDKVKESAFKLTWSESWATYFALTAQIFYKSKLKEIYTCCNSGYESDNYRLSIDYEYCNSGATHFHDYGEASEDVIISILWDLFDDEKENGIKEDFDKISLTSKELWDVVADSHVKTLFEFINKLTESGKVDGNALAELLGYYGLNATDLSLVKNSCPLKFTWSVGVGVSPKYYPNNQFDLNIYDAVTDRILISKSGLLLTSYTLTASEWGKLSDLGRDFYWIVDAYQNDSNLGGNCITGPYRSKRYDVKFSDIYTCTTITQDVVYSGSIDIDTIALYKFTSSGYFYSQITVTSNITLCMDLYHDGESLFKDGCIAKAGTNISFTEELVSGGSTIFIKISSYNGRASTFTIKIEKYEPHTHSYSGYEQYNDSQHARVCSCGDKIYESHTRLRTVAVSETHHGDYCRCGHTWNLKKHGWRASGTSRICSVCKYVDMQLPGMSVTVPCDDIMSHCGDCA